MDDLMVELRDAYAAELPGLIHALAALVEEAAAEAQAIPPALRAAHRLRGTAGSYGFAEVGEVAGRIEDALDAGAPVPPELLQALLALVPHARPKGGTSGSSK
jgi:HPt (histidine-containing phosphotransfer) domain-containing protein